MIQLSLTLACGYCSFILAEHVFGMSGVLCTVAAALMLADKMWPVLVSKEAVHEVWHALEFLANTLIFFLAGALTGDAMLTVEAEDWLHLLVIYLGITVI